MDSLTPHQPTPASASQYLPLRVALLGNAIFSLVSGLALLLYASPISTWMELPFPLIYRLIGVGLLIFSADLFHQVTQRRMQTWRVVYTLAGDMLWVIATAAGILFYFHQLSANATLSLTIVASIVGAFASVQYFGLDRALRVPGTALHRHCVHVLTNTPKDPLWTRISDLGNIARYMPMLKRSMLRTRSTHPTGQIRECEDQHGHVWAEQCIDYKPGKSFTLRFLTEEKGFPFPATTMYGGWSAHQADFEHTEVIVWWELKAKPRFLAPLIVAILTFQADRDFPQVIQRMASDHTAAGTSDSSTPSSLPPKPSSKLLPKLC